MDVHILVNRSAGKSAPLTGRGDVVTPDLVARAQRGDHDAFEQLAAALVGRLYGTANLILRDPELASDAVQEALISVWQSLPALRDPMAFNGWVHRILVRNCYRAIRGRRRLMEVKVAEIDSPVQSDEERVDTSDQIERAFLRLTPEHRAVLVLHHRLGLRLEESAQAMDIPLGTVKSRLNRATAAFRAALEAEGRDATLIRGQTA